MRYSLIILTVRMRIGERERMACWSEAISKSWWTIWDNVGQYGIISPSLITRSIPKTKRSLQNNFLVKVGNLAQPTWPPLPERWDFFRKFVGNFWQKKVKYAIKTVIYKSWDWVRPPPPLLGQIPNFNRKFVLGAPLIACQQSRIPNSLLIALGPHFEISEPK